MAFEATISQIAQNTDPITVVNNSFSFAVSDTSNGDGAALALFVAKAAVAFATDADASGWGAAWADLSAEDYTTIRQHLANWQATIAAAE